MQCFFPQNVIDGVNTPIFLLNAAYDAWQVHIYYMHTCVALI
jgi:hypothetical protein